MERALQLAQQGIGTTRPNPSVGCIIVHDDKIIGEGFTSPYGGSHAEVNAINSVVDASLLRESTIYVTLEPCNHYGKTPPCSDLILEKGIPNIVIGMLDPNEKVAGRGIKKLEDAGRSVAVGVLEEACKTHHKRFLTFQTKKRPYIILKWAQTIDGLIAPEASTRNKNEPIWITNVHSRQLVHKWRSQEHAILVGTNTVLADDPGLTARDWAGISPIRVVLDKHGVIDKGYSVMSDDAKTIVLIEKSEVRGQRSEFDHVDHIPIYHTKEVVQQTIDVLFNLNIQSVIVEGGAKTLQLFIDAGLWDEARVFTGVISFGNGVKAPRFKGMKTSQETIIDDTLTYYRNA